MNHLKAIAIKFLASFAILYIILGVFFEGMTFGDILLISLVWSVASYIIGDMLILPRTNNFIATLADMGLALATIWIMSESLVYGEWFAEALIASLGITLFEYMFHKYVSDNVIQNTEANQDQNRQTNLQYQTEASEEFTPENRTSDNQNEQ